MATAGNSNRIVGKKNVYLITNETPIGQGAFGAVFEGCNERATHHRLAIKREDKGSSTPKELKILQDVSRSASLNLVQIKEVIVDEKYLYTVMEHCQGGDLKNYLEQNGGQLELLMLNRLAIHLAVAMEALYSNHIIHRDLKPGNIMVVRNESKPYPRNVTFKVGDFGISRHLNLNDLARTRTGTELYAAPEVILKRPYDYKCDLWSIGVILFECLTRQLPVNLSEAIAMLSARAQVALFHLQPYILKIESQEHRQLTDLINKLLVCDPADRITMKDFFKHEYINTKEFIVKIKTRQVLKSIKNISYDTNLNIGD